MLQWFIRFPEFAEFGEFLFHLGKTLNLDGGGSDSTFKARGFETHCWKSSFLLIQSNKLN